MVVSQDARKIAFASGSSFAANLWRIPIASASGKNTGEPIRITEGLESRSAPFPSRDARQIVYVAGNGEIRIRDIDSGKEGRLAWNAKSGSAPVLSEDGTQVAYYVDERDKLPIFTAPSRGGVIRKVCDNWGRPIQWIAGGNKLLYDRAGPERKDLAIFDLGTRRSTIIVHDAKNQLYTPRLSPTAACCVSPRC